MLQSERSNDGERPVRGGWFLPALAFVCAAALAGTQVWRSEQQRLDIERARLSDTVADHAHEVERHLERALSATYPLAALVRHAGGEIPDFSAVAGEILPYYPGVAALMLAPGGVLRRAVPLAGNEEALGHDLLADPQRNKEAFLARDSGRLTLAGPFPLLQGGLGAAGRLPVFLDDGAGGHRFWGFTIVLLRFPRALDPVRLDALQERGYAYELWRVHPDTGARQVIVGSATAPLQAPLDRRLRLANVPWTLSIAPSAGWGDPLGLAYKVSLALLVSLLVGYLARLGLMLRAHRRDLEALVGRRTAELAEREADLKRAQAVAQVGSWVAGVGPSPGGCTLSAEGRRILGLPEPAPFDFQTFMALVEPVDREAVSWAWNGAHEGSRIGVEFRVQVGGRQRWIRAKTELVRRADGQRHVVGTLQDITERRQADQALRVAATAFETSEGIVICDADQIIQQVNRMFVRITGYTEDEVVGRHTRSLRSGRHDAAFYAAMWKSILASGSWAGEIWNRRRSGEEYPAWLTITAVHAEDSGVSHYVATLIDITQRKAAEERIARLAFFDPLTRLPNRRLFMDRVQHALATRARTGGCGAMLFLDLDHFKEVNDTHGHHRGDRLLQQVAQRLTAAVRACDTVARFGGDEFVVLLEDLGHDLAQAQSQARTISEDILARLNEVFDLDGVLHTVTPSIGFTVFDAGPVTVFELLRQADVAMYQAKAAGRNGVCLYDPSVPAVGVPPLLEDEFDETAW